MASDDAQTDLKKRARRRLVGAAALALFAVIVLPMVMDPEPDPVGEDIQVRIPSQEGANFAARSIAPPVPAPQSPPVVDATPPATAIVPPAPAPEAPPASAPAGKPKPAEKPKDVAKPEQTAKAVPADEQQRVEAILAGKAGAPAPSGDGFVVQLGAFSNPDSATALAGKAREKGFEAFTRKMGSTTRVRVGPYASREAAEQAAARLSAQGFKGVVMPRG